MRAVLAVGAHPDDVELGCGGTLAALGGHRTRVAGSRMVDPDVVVDSDEPAVRVPV